MVYIAENDYVVERILKIGEIDILQLFDTVEDKSFYEFALKKAKTKYKPKKVLAARMKISMKGIADTKLKKALIEFLVSELRTSGKLSPLNYWCDRLIGLDSLITCHEDVMGLSYEDFKGAVKADVIIKKGGYNYYTIKHFCNAFINYCYFADSIEDPFSRDIWLLEEYPISSSRFNKTAMARTLRFNRIENEKNRYFVKKYIEYRIYETNMVVNQLIEQVFVLGILLNMVGKPYDEWNADDAEAFISCMNQKYPLKTTFIHHLIAFETFTSFLVERDFITDNPIKCYRNLIRLGHAYQYKATAPDEFVISQIFSCLDKISDKRYVLFFLLLYCTGMRASEVVSLDRWCLEQRENGSYVCYYSIKMKKYVTNIIPQALYDMIKEHIKNMPESKDYLFFSKKGNWPLQSNMLAASVRDEFKRQGIKNPDGSDYCFKAHSFRHLMGVRMREQNIPFQFIQEQLHHESPEMTLAYVEYLDKQKIQKMIKYNDAEHMKLPQDIIEKKMVSDAYTEVIRENLNSQLLPNGICGRPVQLGRCSHANNCLVCPNFRTDIRFLDVHKEQARNAEKYIVIAEQRGWLPQVETQKNIKRVLDNIIQSIEGGGAYNAESN